MKCKDDWMEESVLVNSVFERFVTSGLRQLHELIKQYMPRGFKKKKKEKYSFFICDHFS